MLSWRRFEEPPGFYVFLFGELAHWPKAKHFAHLNDLDFTSTKQMPS